MFEIKCTYLQFVATVLLFGNQAFAYGYGGYGGYPPYGVYCSYADHKSSVITYGDCFDYWARMTEFQKTQLYLYQLNDRQAELI
jgi:hypothetical protein